MFCSSAKACQETQGAAWQTRSLRVAPVSPPTCPEPSTHVYGSLPLTDTHLLAEAFFCLEEPPHSIEQQIVSAVKVKACHAPPISSLGTFARCLSKGEKWVFLMRVMSFDVTTVIVWTSFAHILKNEFH